jgi:hydroxymethylpyrimidine pyrophosphatase-like HAD family hydrolase
VVWFFQAIAFDLDGTLSAGGVVSPDVLDVLDSVRADRALLLVTGRVRRDLDQVFSGLAGHFDAVVSENGAVLSTASGVRGLHEPVDETVDRALSERGVRSDRGEVLLAIDGSDSATATEVITELGQDYQVVHNRGAAMILPAEVTKGTGLLCALDELGLSAHNTIAVGDAENDLTLLRTAEVGVAVQNAVASLAEHADLILDQPDGAGVVSLVSGDLLSGRRSLCPARRWVPVGMFEDGSAAALPGSQSSVLITGETSSGKSYLAGLLAERWIDAGYSVLVVDPEGDHLGLAERPGVHLVDAAAHLPPPHELLALLRPRHASLVLDLSGLSVDAQLLYLKRLPAALAAERSSSGIPHWVVFDEAHQQGWLDEYTAVADTVAGPGTCLVTWRPELLPKSLSRAVDYTLTVSAPTTPTDGGERPSRGMFAAAGEVRRFQVGERVSAHVRHWHKYVSTPLPSHRRFYFRDRDPGDAAAAAATLEEFSNHRRDCDLATLGYHLSRGDFSRWINGTLADHTLGADLLRIEQDLAARQAAALERARHQIRAAIERRYLDR